MGDDKIPPPGSPDAVALGCLCPVIDNGHGNGAQPDGKGGMLYWINSQCAVHVEQEEAS